LYCHFLPASTLQVSSVTVYNSIKIFTLMTSLFDDVIIFFNEKSTVEIGLKDSEEVKMEKITIYLHRRVRKMYAYL